jgi:flagellin
MNGTIFGIRQNLLPNEIQNPSDSNKRGSYIYEILRLSFRINHNPAASSAQFNANQIESKLTGSINRLSSGLRLNQVQDDPAAMISSESLRHQLNTLEEANRNSQNAINFAKLADSSMGEVNKLLTQARGLAVSAGNTGTKSPAELQSLQNEIKDIMSGINRIATSTRWGGNNLLDGTAGVSAAVTNGTLISQVGFKGSSYNVPLVSAPITVAQTVPATQTLLNGNVAYATGATVANPGSFTLNGFSFASDGVETIQNVLDRMNSVSLNTGVTATLVAGVVEFRSLEYGSKFPVQLTDTNGVFSTIPSPVPTVAGADALATVQFTTEQGVQTVPFRGGRSQNTSGLLLADDEGNTIRLTTTGNGNAALSAGAAVANVTGGSMSRFQLGNAIPDITGIVLPDIRTSKLAAGALGTMTLDTIDVTNSGGVGLALQMIDAAIDQVGEIRGEIGSFQKYTLDSRSRMLDNIKQNYSASESAIRDADVAEEMTEFTKNQVMQQTGVAMLSQANQIPQQVLQMLRN